MYLQRLEISGFKSFANKTMLEFPGPKAHDADKKCGIAVIVGPNGSGKSNVADAIRWVLGEQSLKLLRGKKTEDVIFSGSEKKARLGLAEASLFLNNEDRMMDVDYPEVVITRRVHRDGTSEYIVNKNLVRLQDILMLTAKAHFGQKSYSVIGQGMVDSILNATPFERKDFFDEAVGVKQYQIKREQSIHKLETTWKNLKQAQAVLEEIEPRLRSLSRQGKRLERREEIEEELLEKQKKYYGFLYSQLHTQKKQLEPRHKKLDAEFQTRARDLSEIQNQLNILEKEDSRTEVFNLLQQKYQKILEKKNSLKEEKIILENKIELLRHKEVAKIIPIHLDQVLQGLKNIYSLNKELRKKLLSIKSIDDLNAFKAEFEAVSEKIDELVLEFEKPKIEVKKSTEPDPALSQKLAEAIKNIESIEAELARSRDEVANFNQKEEQKKGKFFELQRKFQAKQGEYNSISQELSNVRIEIAKFETKMEDLMNEISGELKDSSWLKDVLSHENVDTQGTLSEIHNLKHQLELIGGIDPETVKEYTETKERFDFLDTQTKDLKKSIEGLRTVIEELDETIHRQFDVSFKNINRDFQKYFHVLFNGGKAELVLIKETEKEEKEIEKLEAAMEGVEIVEQESEEDKAIKKLLKGTSEKVIKGVEIIATPPGKKLKSISMLSGGERALTSIGLICAIISTNPSPFVVLDEVEAALDEANSDRFSSIINQLSHKTQFIIITHNRSTMHRASVLYGVTMGDDGVSKLLSLKMEEAEGLVNR